MTLSLHNELLKRKRLGNFRQLAVTENLIDFSSNDYLGLARSSDLSALYHQECKLRANTFNGLGSTGSRLLTGNSAYAQNLEARIAAFHGYEAGLLFNCGYMANVGLLSTIANASDVILFDSGIHASMHDGMRLGKAKSLPFKHNDPAHLEKRLKDASSHENRFICIESIYSTDGSQAPLNEICLLAKEYDAHVIVDEAHAIGVFGPHGRGLVAEKNLQTEVFAQVNTFGKALGTHGAIVLGSHLLKEALINFATSYIYTTAMPFHALAAIKCSYELFPELEIEREHLRKLISMFRDRFTTDSTSPIQSITIKGNEAVRKVSTNLKSQGFDVRALLSPTVRQGHEVLRICLHAFNTEQELNQLLKELNDLDKITTEGGKVDAYLSLSS